VTCSHCQRDGAERSHPWDPSEPLCAECHRRIVWTWVILAALAAAVLSGAFGTCRAIAGALQ
jgi:hypothetical protein